ncbi:MAG: hypothetical protein ACOYD4_01695 [Solirubrobacterales bacterium]
MSDATKPMIEALSAGIEELADSGRTQSAEALGLVLLGIDEQASRNAFANGIERMGTISTPALARAALEAVAHRRHGNDWPRWLDRISLETVRELEEGPILVGALGRSLWLKANLEEEPVDGDALKAALASTERLAQDIDPDRSGLAEEIMEVVAAAPIDEASAKAQEQKLVLAERFAAAGLVRREDYAPAVLVAIAQALNAQMEPLELNHPVSRHVERWGTELAPAGDDQSRDQLREAASQSPWLQSPFRDSLNLAGSLRDDPAEISNPYTEEQMLALVEEHRGWFDTGLAIWIEKIRDQSAVAIGRVVAPFRGDEVPQLVSAAIKRRFTEPEQRAEFAVAALRGMLAAPPDADFLAAIDLQNADPGPVIDLLAELYGEAANNEQRENILTVAHGMTPLPDAQRKQLITEIVIPMAHQGKGALDIVLANLEICLPPPYGTRQKLRDTLRERAKDKAQRKRVDSVLLEVGLTKRSGFFGRSRQDVEE